MTCALLTPPQRHPGTNALYSRAPISLLHIQLTEGAAPGAVMLHLDGQAVAPRQATAHHKAAQGRQIAVGMHQPSAQQTHQGTEL